MLNDLFYIILQTAEDAFLQVGVFVGAVLLLFGYINYKRQGKFIQSLERNKPWQPIFGSLLGLSPGCGGAIFVMPLYLKKTVSFGTIIATLIATMGDSAFVLIATHPKEYLIVSAISLVVAVVTGYIVDAFKMDKGFKQRVEKLERTAETLKDEHTRMEANLIEKGLHTPKTKHLAHEEGDVVDIVFHHLGQEKEEQRWANVFTHNYAYKIFWALVAVGLILGIALLFQIDVNSQFGVPHLGMVLGILGTVFSLLYMRINKKVIKNDCHIEEEHKLMSLKETLIHSAEDTAFVNTWVFVAYLIYELLVYAVGGDAVVREWMLSSGVTTVIIGALVGLIPGCGPQIIFVSLYAQGMIPFAALLANAISQDGDALFPMLAIDKKSSLIATLITTIPALIVGLLLYYIF